MGGGLGATSLGVLILNNFKGLLMIKSVSYTHLRAHETVLDLVCRLLLEKKKKNKKKKKKNKKTKKNKK